MPKNTATRKSIDRQQKSYKRLRRANPNGPGILIEGDSWFSTPIVSWDGPTLVARLKRHRQNGKKQFAIVSVANPGADLVEMITPNNIDLAFAMLGLTDRQKYNLVLLSCGGNDILGDELDDFLVDVSPGTPARRCLDRAGTNMEKAARCVLDCDAYVELVHNKLGGRLKNFRSKVLRPLNLQGARILIHGYDYPIPDGRPLKVFGLEFGPWLLNKFKRHHIPQKYHTAIVKLLIDEFNSMLKNVATSQPKFHYLDFRGLLTKRSDWADEIHPHTNTGMLKLREEMVPAIHAVHAGTAGSVIGGGRITEEYSCR